MATTNISASIALYDKISAPITKMLSALDNLTSAFDDVASSVDGGFDTTKIETARRQIASATDDVIQLGNETDENTRSQEQYNGAVKGGSVAMSGLLQKALALGSAIVFGRGIKSAIEFASNLEEVQNVVDVTFANSSQRINEWAKTTMNSFGLNELSAKKYAGTLGAMLKSSGIAGKSVDEMSMKITELAGDMASFYNLEGDEAFSKLRSGISGETEPLKQLGINMSVANLEAYALSQGIETAYSKMSQAEQMTLRYNYLLKATADAQGDFARTSDSFANQQKLLTENWKAFTGELASGMLPYLAQIMTRLNSLIGDIANKTESMTPIIAFFGQMMVDAFEALANTAQFVIENWSMIAPFITGAIVALGLYLAVMAIVNTMNAIAALKESIKAASLMMSTGATFATTAAQYGLNAALLACPLTWIILLVIALVAAFYAVIAAINKTKGTTLSATGIIVGALMSAVAFIWNLFVGLVEFIAGVVNYWYNLFGSFVNFFANVFKDPIGSVIHLFGDFADRVLGIIESVAKAIDAVFGSNLADSVSSFREKVSGWIDDKAKEYGNGEYEKVMENLNLDASSFGISRWAYGDAYNTGYAWGEGLENKISNFTSGFGTGDLGAYDSYDTSQIPSNISDTASNTGKVADSMEITSEDLKYLRDIAERDVINRFTTAEIKVEMNNNNNISSEMDLDGIVDYLAREVNGAMAIAAEGVHI